AQRWPHVQLEEERAEPDEAAILGQRRRRSGWPQGSGGRRLSLRTRASSPLPWLAGLLAVYLLAPILAFVVRLGQHGASSPSGLGPALETSLFTATISAALVTVFGVPLAYLLARGRGLTTRLLTVLVALPLALPPLMSGLLLLYIVGPYTAVGELFDGR